MKMHQKGFVFINNAPASAVITKVSGICTASIQKDYHTSIERPIVPCCDNSIVKCYINVDRYVAETEGSDECYAVLFDTKEELLVAVKASIEQEMKLHVKEYLKRIDDLEAYKNGVSEDE